MAPDNDRTQDATECSRARAVPPRVNLPQQLLTESEAAELLHLSPTTLKKWRRTRSGPTYYRLGSAVRYKREDLDRFIGESAVHSRSPRNAASE